MKKPQALNIFFHLPIIAERDSGIPRDGQFFYKSLKKLLEDDAFRRKLKEQNLELNFELQTVEHSRIENLFRWKLKKEREGIHFYQQIPASLPLDQKSLSSVYLFRVHDLFPLEYPKLYSFRSRQLFKRRIELIPRADVLIANSDSTATSIKRYLQKWQTLRVIECTTPSFTWDGEFEIDKTNLVPTGIDKFVLSVGAAVKRKSPLALIEFWERKIAIHGYSLVMIGERTDHEIVKAIESRIRKNRDSNPKIYFYSNLENEKLLNYYKSARGYIGISSFEGFNIPLHDAVMCGLPVLCHSDSIKSQAVKSFAFEQGLCFDFNQVNEFITKMESSYVRNVDLLNDLRQRQSTRYSNAIERLLVDAIMLWQNEVSKRQHN